MFLITVVSIVINYSENVHRFINAEVGFITVMKDYYIYYIPWINGLMWPLFSLIAVIFFTSRLAKSTEIVATLSSGISIYRLLVPYIIAGSLIASLLWVGKNYIIPHSNKVKHTFESDVLNKSHKKTLINDIHFFIGPEEKVYIKKYIKRDTSVLVFRVEKFSEGKLVEVLRAEKLSFKAEPKTWTIKNYDIRKINGLNESIFVAQGEELDTTFNLTPEDFTRNTKGMENMTTIDLIDYIDRKQKSGIGVEKNFIVEYHLRNAQPFAIIILTIIGFAVASRKVRGGMGLHLAIGVIIGSCYVVISQFSSTFSNNLSLSPGLGAWIPNIIFGLVAIYLLFKAQK